MWLVFLLPRFVWGVVAGGVLLSHAVSRAVPWALEGLTSGFGMFPGVSRSAVTTGKSVLCCGGGLGGVFVVWDTVQWMRVVVLCWGCGGKPSAY